MGFRKQRQRFFVGVGSICFWWSRLHACMCERARGFPREAAAPANVTPERERWKQPVRSEEANIAARRAGRSRLRVSWYDCACVLWACVHLCTHTAASDRVNLISLIFDKERLRQCRGRWRGASPPTRPTLAPILWKCCRCFPHQCSHTEGQRRPRTP